MGGRGGGMNWEMIRIHITVLLCVKQIASGKLLYSSASSGQCSKVTQMGGWGGVRRRSYRERRYMHTDN